jgi:hypothetical protein
MKTILLSAIGTAAILFVSACASHDVAPVPVSTSTTTTETDQAVAPVAPVPAQTTTTETVHSY